MSDARAGQPQPEGRETPPGFASPAPDIRHLIPTYQRTPTAGAFRRAPHNMRMLSPEFAFLVAPARAGRWVNDEAGGHLGSISASRSARR